MHMHDSGAGFLGVAPEHTLGLLAALLALPSIWLALVCVRYLAGHGSPFARHWRAAYLAAPLTQRTAAGAMAVSGFIHLGLIPAHLRGEPGTALLFLLNAAAFLFLAAGAFTLRRWHRAAAALLILTVFAYLWYLLSGREGPDQLGIVTPAIEIVALGLVVMSQGTVDGLPASLRCLALTAGSVAALTLVTGALAWAVEFRAAQSAAGMTGQPGMVMQEVPALATPAQVQAAATLAAQTRAGIARYADLSAALADGYRPSTDPHGSTVHYLNQAYVKDGRTLDPQHPEALVYANSRSGPVLLGAMYMMPKPGLQGPDVGGPLTDWHRHENVCFSLSNRMVSGFTSPFGNCAAGSLNVPTAAMLHVWTIENPTGTYGELNQAWLRQLTAR